MKEPTFEQPKEQISCIELASDKRPETEDSAFVDKKRGILVAADGVTRGPFSEGEDYPTPSPARLASEAATKAIGEHLTSLAEINTETIRDAIDKGNKAIFELNKKLGLWDDNDYLQKDLAGTVVSAFALSKDKAAIYAFIGDCRLAKINSKGEITWSSPDEVTPIRPHFPTVAEVGKKERFLSVRRDFRNKPEASHPTYGVLTGEDSAMEYVRTGVVEFEKGDAFLVFTDGVEPLLDDPKFMQLLTTGNSNLIRKYILDNLSEGGQKDDATLLVYRA